MPFLLACRQISEEARNTLYLKNTCKLAVFPTSNYLISKTVYQLQIRDENILYFIRKLHFTIKLSDLYLEYNKDATGRFLATLVAKLANKTPATQSIHLEFDGLDLRKVTSNYCSVWPPNYTFCWSSRPIWLRTQAAAAVVEMRKALDAQASDSIVLTSNVEDAAEGLEVRKVTGWKIRVRSRDIESQGCMMLDVECGGLRCVLDGRYDESLPLYLFW